jgi:hypothetical protein
MRQFQRERFVLRRSGANAETEREAADDNSAEFYEPHPNFPPMPPHCKAALVSKPTVSFNRRNSPL